jgi:hypothetical protein
LTFNEPIEPDIFTVWGLDITSKTKIRDEIQGTMSTLALDDKKEKTVNSTRSPTRILIPGIAILGLIAVAFFGVLVKGKKKR